MDPADIQHEQRRLAESYRDKRDEELEDIAGEAYDLTDLAREALQFEISSRGLKLPLNLTPPPSDDDVEALPPSDDGFIPDDLDLLQVYVADDLNQLRRVLSILEPEGVECFLGEAKTRDAQRLVPGDLLNVRVFRAAFARADQLLRDEMPGYSEYVDSEAPDAEVRCPKCHSEGVILEELDPAVAGKPSHYHWTCDDCGYQWEDDGVVDDKPSAGAVGSV